VRAVDVDLAEDSDGLAEDVVDSKHIRLNRRRPSECDGRVEAVG
jgi:hypothetical protein